MAYKIVTKTEQDLREVLEGIDNWFDTAQDFEVGFTEEKRKFLNPESKAIEERDINVILIKEYASGKQAKVKFIPLLVSTEMKVEINGEGEFLIKNKIANQLKKKAVLKSYNRDTLKPANPSNKAFSLETNT